MSFCRCVSEVIIHTAAKRFNFLTMWTPVFIGMQVNLYTFFAQRSYPVKTIYHPAIIRGIWDIQCYDMEVFIQNLLSLLFTYNILKKRQVNFYE